MQKRLVTAALIALFVPAAAIAQKVSYDFDKTAPFASFKTYSHKEGTKVGQELIDDRIVAALEAELAAKGLTRVDSNPDLYVVYHVAFDKEKDISTYSSGRRRLRRLRLGVGRRLGRRDDHDPGARHPYRHACRGPGRCEEGTACLARHGGQGSGHAGQAREARQEHQQRGEEDLQELPTESEDVAAWRSCLEG